MAARTHTRNWTLAFLEYGIPAAVDFIGTQHAARQWTLWAEGRRPQKGPRTTATDRPPAQTKPCHPKTQTADWPPAKNQAQPPENPICIAETKKTHEACTTHENWSSRSSLSSVVAGAGSISLRTYVLPRESRKHRRVGVRRLLELRRRQNCVDERGGCSGTDPTCAAPPPVSSSCTGSSALSGTQPSGRHFSNGAPAQAHSVRPGPKLCPKAHALVRCIALPGTFNNLKVKFGLN